MIDYEKLYKIAFNGLADALDIFEKEGYQSARETLMKAQQAAEDCFIKAEEDIGMLDGEDYPLLYVLPHDAYTGKKPPL